MARRPWKIMANSAEGFLMPNRSRQKELEEAGKFAALYQTGSRISRRWLIDCDLSVEMAAPNAGGPGNLGGLGGNPPDPIAPVPPAGALPLPPGDIPEDAELYGDAVVSLWFEEFEGPYNPEASCHMCWFEGRLTCIVLSWHIPAL